MKITGQISNSDYVNCLRFSTIIPRNSFIIFNFIIGASLSVVVIILTKPNYDIRLLFCIMGIFLSYNYLRYTIWIKNYIKNAKSNNIGECEYEISDTSVIFRGSHFSCNIPYSSISQILERNGTHYLKFGNASGFIIPKMVLTGNVNNFIDEIRKRIISAQQGDAPEPATIVDSASPTSQPPAR